MRVGELAYYKNATIMLIRTEALFGFDSGENGKVPSRRHAAKTEFLERQANIWGGGRTNVFRHQIHEILLKRAFRSEIFFSIYSQKK